MSRELLEQALAALLGAPIDYDFHGFPMTEDEQSILDAIAALKAELAKPEPEPFAYVTKTGLELARQHEDDVPLYCKEDA